MNRTDVLGFRFVNTGILEAVEYGIRVMAEHQGTYIVAPDSEMLLAARKKESLRAAIENAALILPAGSGILYASHILGIPIKKKISALDYASALMARMGEKNMSVFLLGGDEELLAQAEAQLRQRYPGITVAGTEAGNGQTEQELIEVINAARPDLLLVGLDTPGQELWMHRSSGAVDAGLMIGFGRELKILAGVLAPVPKKWRDAGFEWLYRLIREPWQILRMIRRTGVLFTAVERRLLG